VKKPADVIEVTLQPGDFYFGGANTRISTLLGSCVSITAWHPKRLIGGMCHYLLPGRDIKNEDAKGRYADDAMDLLLASVQQHNTQLNDYQIKIFGGGEMFSRHLQKGLLSIASRNIQAAVTLMAQHHLTPVSQDVGLYGHRTVIFDVWNGNVWVRYKPSMDTKKCR
jgi:chemotaxis protein CheD